jgi:hypothetical protein
MREERGETSCKLIVGLFTITKKLCETIRESYINTEELTII